MTQNPLPEPGTPNLDAAARTPTHFPTMVADLQGLRAELQDKYQGALIDTDSLNAALHAIDTLVGVLGPMV